jgi:hypothetical protein
MRHVPVLAQEDAYLSLTIWSVVLVVVLLVLFTVVAWLRKWTSRQDEPSQTPGTGFTLRELREMHEQGQITDQEFERTRAKVVQDAKTAADQQARTDKTSPQNDQNDRAGD